MPDVLSYTVDKFTFSVATDRRYSAAGVWARAEGDRVTIGVSDFVQQRHGDVAFAEVAAPGTVVAAGDSVATLETIKVTLELPSPVTGTVVAVNDALDLAAEQINEDPYGAGWLAVVAAADWAGEAARLLTPAAYFQQMQAEAQEAL